MRRFGFALGLVLLLIAAGAGVAQLLSLFVASGRASVSIGSIWYGLHGNSLVGFQALVEKNLGELAWAPLQTLLVLPAWLTLGIPGLLLTLLCRPKRRGFD
jgi:hypothetical protein